jgi:hypothetical protein
MSRQEFLDTLAELAGAFEVFPSFAKDRSFVLLDKDGEVLFLQKARPNPDGVLVWVPIALDQPVPMDVDLG